MKRNQDTEQLRLLSVFHYVIAGVGALFSLLPSLHLAMGIAIVLGAFEAPENGSPPPALFGWIFVIFPAIFILCGIAVAVCVAFAGRRLAQHRSYMYCLVMAAILCMIMPFGTVLGVFTIIVLMRPSVRVLFGVDEAE